MLRAVGLCFVVARVWALAPAVDGQVSLSSVDGTSSEAPAAPRVYMVGLQKSGSTVMAAALSAGLGLESSLEAATSCCCSGVECVGEMHRECVDANRLTAPLFNGSAAQYYSWCTAQLQPRVTKADDMLWQVGSLMDYTSALPAGAQGYRTQYVFLVRHPLYNIASLLAWCEQPDMTCDEHMRDKRANNGTNALFYRIFALPETGEIAANARELAKVWKAAARVYLDNPTRFAARLRYEDFVGRPAAELERVRDTLQRDSAVRWSLAPSASRLASLDHAAIARSMGGDYTYVGDYDHHGGDGDELFDEKTASAIVELCKEEMAALGYTSKYITDERLRK